MSRNHIHNAGFETGYDDIFALAAASDSFNSPPLIGFDSIPFGDFDDLFTDLWKCDLGSYNHILRTETVFPPPLPSGLPNDDLNIQYAAEEP